MARVFQSVEAAPINRSYFDLSYTKKFSCDMGQLIPVLCDEMVPGDIFKLGYSMVVRFQPMVAPLLHEVNVVGHYFFVPNRLLWHDWEDFITGGEDGANTSVPPVWNSQLNNPPGLGLRAKGSLWDYFGLPLLNNGSPSGNNSIVDVLDFPRRAYNEIFKEYYRDENIDTTENWASSGIKIADGGNTTNCDPEYNYTSVEVAAARNTTNYRVLEKRWRKDYFTAALPFRQKGVAPVIPIEFGGNVPVVFGDIDTATGNQVYADSSGSGIRRTLANTDLLGAGSPYINVGSGAFNQTAGELFVTSDSLSSSGFDITALREAVAIQRWLERNARAGSRYIESLKAHFGVHPLDARLQRPEYIGGFKLPVIFSEVLQTSESGQETPQGNMAGHGIGAGSGFVGSYKAQEHGWILGIVCFEPKAAYSQGVNRQFTRKTKYDYYWPEFSHLSEQAVLTREIFADGSDNDLTVFGFEGIYDEMRVKHDLIASDMRDTYDYWHLGRHWSVSPKLNVGFLRMGLDNGAAGSVDGGIRKDVFAVQNEQSLIVNFGNKVSALRPLPSVGEPGYMDHI